MQTAIFKSKSDYDLKLLIQLARKLGIKTKILTQTEIEDLGIINAMNIGKTGEYVNTDSYLKKLRK